jgi:uncharacterized protein YndB with AHSA1/START domain/uncharacterized protein YciI
MTSVKKSVTVEASREIAFRVFTENMALWWPAEHHIGKSPLASIILEPRSQGRWAERSTDGSECNWGRVLAWEPPARLVLAWQLDAKFEFNPSFETEVEINFVAEGDKKTRVTLEHKHLERYGDLEARMIATFDSPDGWSLGLLRFANAVASDGKQIYLLRLIPPRPTFAQDMSEQERRVMMEHVVYWQGHTNANEVIAFGPVADPNGAWGVAIVEVADGDRVKKLTSEDPVMVHGLGARYEILPMPRVIMRR